MSISNIYAALGKEDLKKSIFAQNMIDIPPEILIRCSTETRLLGKGRAEIFFRTP